VATLGLGVGGATAIFSVADAVILRPLPFATPERLVLLWQSDTKKNQPFVEMSYPVYRQWRDQNRSFEAFAGMPSTNQSFNLTGRDEPVTLFGRWVTGRFFETLGVAPWLGRTLSTEDDRPGAPRVVVLSHALWRERFSEDASIVGQTLILDDKPFRVVGVMAKGFAYPKGAELWTPLEPAAAEYLENQGVWWMSALGRIRPGVSIESARTEMTTIADRVNRERFQRDGFAAVLTPISDAIFGATRPALLALLLAVGLVVLIACANVAGLSLVELSERRGELALRQALGASRARLATDVLGESVLLAALGGGLGLGLARGLIPVLIALSPPEVFRVGEAHFDPRAFLFGCAASLGAALLCATGPFLLTRRMALEGVLRAGARAVASPRNPLRSTLVIAEVALALVLLVGAGLLFRSFGELSRVPLGFEASGVLSVAVDLPDTRYPEPPARRRFYQELIRRVGALPGVTSAATVTLRPLWGTVGMDWPFTVEGQSPEEAEKNSLVNFEAVSSEYFRTMGIAVRRGRVFADSDADGQPGVVVVSESLARRYWPGAEPIGKRLKIPLPPTPYHQAWLTVVGVVADARYREIRNSRLDLYMSFLQADHTPHHLVVRAAVAPASLGPAIRETVRALDRDQPVTEIVAMSEVVRNALGEPRFAASVFGAFALIAALLAVLGLYGLVAYSVSRRTREIGVRVALGALPRDVRRLVLGEGLRLAGIGVAIGVLLAAAASRLLGSLLFSVRPADPLTFASVPILLLSVAALACLVPALRAARVDPTVALRAE